MIIKEGYIKYEKPRGLKKAWFKVYLVCKTHYLEIYKNESEYHNIGTHNTIPLHAVNNIFMFDNTLHISINGTVKKFKLDDINELNNWKTKINDTYQLSNTDSDNEDF